MMRVRDDCLVIPVLGAFLAVLSVVSLQAQIDRATLIGTVKDPSGAAIVGAEVTAVAQTPGFEDKTETNSSGEYRISGLGVGSYTVRVARKGFATIEYKDVTLLVGETRTLNAQMRVSTAMEKIVVEVTPTSLQESSPEMSSVIKGQEIQSVPVNGRNWATLLLLAPGAIDDGGGDQRTIRFAGRARDDNNYTMDGIDALRRQKEDQRHHLPFSKEESFGASDRFIRRKGAQVC